ncbi:SDR family oxidoreductase [Fodinicola acaciae]|uniref:SDR family oxidoreductase n=1 Tax=Fodinicola acaciae TaxID=2681555 RepID=UPI0013D0D364|nr:SDR family oxidoreductase [Fodinicola acaciae]
MTAEPTTVQSGEVRLAVWTTPQRAGDPDAPTVVLVHGYPDTHIVWDEVVAELSERFNVVTYDVRGAGGSEPPKDKAGYQLDRLAADFFAVADAVSPDRPVHVVAHDWGSIQAWEAVTEPGAHRRIASYTSISGPCLDHVGEWIQRRLTNPTPKHLRQLAVQQLHSWYIVAFHLPVLAPLAWRLGLSSRWSRILRTVEGVRPSAGHPAPTLTSDAVRGISLYRANMRPRLSDPRPRSTEVPVQVIHPSGDHYVSAALSEDLEMHAPRLWRRSLAARHWAPLTHAPAVARMVTELIDHVGGGDASPELARARVGAPKKRAFDRKLVVVTGAGSGIGRATALAFARLGARVVVGDIDLAAAERTATLAALVGPPAHAYEVNVADEKAMHGWAADVIATHGVPDVLVNNAGIGHSGTFLNTTTEEWQRVLDVNLWGVIYGCQAFGTAMAERGEGGHIVNVSSAAAYLPTKLLTAYATSKSAVFMLSDCLRAEMADHDIGVSAICPGMVNTNITRTSTFSAMPEAEQQRQRARVSKAYARRNFGPEGVAKEIVRAVWHGRAVVPVTVEAKVARLLSRVSPAVLRRAARIGL